MRCGGSKRRKRTNKQRRKKSRRKRRGGLRFGKSRGTVQPGQSCERRNWGSNCTYNHICKGDPPTCQKKESLGTKIQANVMHGLMKATSTTYGGRKRTKKRRRKKRKSRRRR